MLSEQLRVAWFISWAFAYIIADSEHRRLTWKQNLACCCSELKPDVNIRPSEGEHGSIALG